MTKHEFIKYCFDTYGTAEEYPFNEDFETAVLRHSDNRKWYAIVMKVSRRKFGIDSDEKIDVVNIKLPFVLLGSYDSEDGIYPAYHMNKNHWVSALLPDVSDELMEYLVNISFDITKSKNKKTSKNQVLYELLTSIPRGKVVTYGTLAELLGNKSLARAIGNALHSNPDGEKYPCYKVVNGKGELSNAYAFGGIEEQKRRLEKDGIAVENYKVDLKKYGYKVNEND